MNINSGVKNERFYLQTGGETVNDDNPLWGTMNRAPEGLPLPDFNFKPESKEDK